MTETTAADKRRSFIREAAKRLILRKFSSAVCGGKLHRDYLISLGMPEHRIFTKYDVVDNDYFRQGDGANLDFLPGLKDRRPFFLASSRFLPRKNLYGLLTAYGAYRSRALEGWRLVLLGSGTEEQPLRAKVDAENIPDVTFAGFRQIDELPTYYAAAGCFVHPALSEPWGLVVNEAMAAGLPILVSKNAGCAPDLVEPGKNGLWFDPRLPEELAEAMLTVSQDDELRHRMGLRSTEIIAQWTVQHFAASLWSAFSVPTEQYRLVRYGRRNVVAYPDGSASAKQRHLSSIRAFTPKRRIIAASLRVATATGADRLGFSKFLLDDQRLLPPQVYAALEAARARLGGAELTYTLSWPSEKTRPRTYAYAFDAKLSPVAFIKFAEDEISLLENEFSALKALANVVAADFRIPRALFFEVQSGVAYLGAECIPLSSRGSQPVWSDKDVAECISRYAGPVVTCPPDELRASPWMQRLWSMLDQENSFAHAVQRDQLFPCRVCRVHGDLTSANLVSSGRETWVIDWELSNVAGPELTDFVTFFLGKRQAELVKRPHDVLREFRNHFIDDHSEEEQRKARLALAFLYSARSGLGERLVKAWNMVAE